MRSNIHAQHDDHQNMPAMPIAEFNIDRAAGNTFIEGVSVIVFALAPCMHS